MSASLLLPAGSSFPSPQDGSGSSWHPPGGKCVLKPGAGSSCCAINSEPRLPLVNFLIWLYLLLGQQPELCENSVAVPVSARLWTAQAATSAKESPRQSNADLLPEAWSDSSCRYSGEHPLCASGGRDGDKRVPHRACFRILESIRSEKISKTFKSNQCRLRPKVPFLGVLTLSQRDQL